MTDPASSAEVRTYALTGSGRLTPCESGQVFDAARRGDAHHWVDLTAPSNDELSRWLRTLSVPELVYALSTDREALQPAGDPRSGTAVLDDAVFFFFPVYGSQGIGPVVRFNGVCIAGVLLTFHEQPLPVLTNAASLVERGDLLPEASVSGLVSTLTRFCTRRSADTSSRLRHRIADMSARLAADASPVPLEEILACDEAVQVLGATVDEQLDTMRELSTARTSALDLHRLASYYSANLENLETLNRSVDRLERRSNSLRDQYDSHLAERTNRRVSTLTILTAIFMPATLIAGIYGMNFENMPGLHMAHGYSMALGAMGAVAVAGLLFFWKGGWFR